MKFIDVPLTILSSMAILTLKGVNACMVIAVDSLSSIHVLESPEDSMGCKNQRVQDFFSTDFYKKHIFQGNTPWFSWGSRDQMEFDYGISLKVPSDHSITTKVFLIISKYFFSPEKSGDNLNKKIKFLRSFLQKHSEGVIIMDNSEKSLPRDSKNFLYKTCEYSSYKIVDTIPKYHKITIFKTKSSCKSILDNKPYADYLHYFNRKIIKRDVIDFFGTNLFIENIYTNNKTSTSFEDIFSNQTGLSADFITSRNLVKIEDGYIIDSVEYLKSNTTLLTNKLIELCTSSYDFTKEQLQLNQTICINYLCDLGGKNCTEINYKEKETENNNSISVLFSGMAIGAAIVGLGGIIYATYRKYQTYKSYKNPPSNNLDEQLTDTGLISVTEA